MKNEAGSNLAKVLWYYNLIPSTTSMSYKIICPLHEDINPSMIVNLDTGRWYCFGCNESGDAPGMVKAIESKTSPIGDLKAYSKYLSILKSDKCSNIKVSPAQSKTKKRDKELYDIAYDYYHGLSKVDWTTEYEDAMEVKSYLLKRGFTEHALNRCGAKVTYNPHYPVIFPMMDNGKFKGWVSRTTLKEIEQRRKYLYNEGFSRATTLVGDYGKARYIIVVEGYMDRLKFIQFGEENVVAILGWKMSKQQEEKIGKSKSDYIISALDNDEAGRKGHAYLTSIFGADKVIRWQYLKGIKDPGEMKRNTFNKMHHRTMALYKSKLKENGKK